MQEQESEDLDNYYSNAFYDMLDKVIARAEREMPEDGDFAPIYEQFPNRDESVWGVSRYQFRIFKMPTVDVPDTRKRYLMAAVYSTDGYRASVLIGVGYRDKILEIIRSADFPTTLNNAFLDLVDLLQSAD